MRTTLFLVRHGQTVLNAEGRFRGRRDPPLDAIGLAQAETAGARLAATDLRAVYASPLRRAVQTAEPIAKWFGLPVHLLPDLIDMDLGAWEGLTPEEAHRDSPDAYALFRGALRDAQPPAGERMAEVENRVMSALNRLVDKHRGEVVAAISHEVPIRLALSRIRGVVGVALWDFDLPTGSITHLEDLNGYLRLVAGPAPR